MRQFLIKRSALLVCSTVLLMRIDLTSSAQSKTNNDSLTLENTIAGFLTAFRNLDTTNFDSYFDQSVIVFFPPSVKYPYKVSGKTDVLRTFHSFFSNIRASKSGPPFLTIDPQKKDIQFEGKIAIVTFELNDPTLLGRRTIVFKKVGQRWKIIHLHASGLPYP
jgi:ketosteroid isomerase-like protein